jgi:hypothetical protein
VFHVFVVGGKGNQEFKRGDVMNLMAFEDFKEENAMAHAKVVSMARASLHRKTIFPGLVSIEVTKSLDENYGLFASVNLDDPLVTLVGQAVGHFVLRPTESWRLIYPSEQHWLPCWTDEIVSLYSSVLLGILWLHIGEIEDLI